MADGRQHHLRQLPGRPRLHPGRLCGLRLRGSLLRGGLRVGQAVDVIGVVLADAGRERLLSDLLILVGHTVLPAPELELQPVPEPQFPGPLLHQMIPLVLVRRQAPEGKPEGQPGKELFLGVGLVRRKSFSSAGLNCFASRQFPTASFISFMETPLSFALHSVVLLPKV